MVMESQIRNAIQTQEFFLHYQPQFDVVTRRIVGAEALLRWRHTELGLISPVEFIPVAEDCGLIVPLGEWVFRTACLQSKAWHEAGLNLSLAVNVSGRQFKEDNLVERFKEILDETGADPAWLELELTESSLMDASETITRKLDALTSLGLKLSIDDFGTGYSSMSYLKRYPISKLKIDRSFVTDISFDTEDQAIAKAIIALGNSMEMRIIAEGIEEEDQLSILLELGCHHGQGYLVSPAVSPDEVVAICELNKINKVFEIDNQIIAGRFA
jgi:EAL domain-containing protein (putative c-di-GMP-specific phosphodiesterase class I)